MVLSHRTERVNENKDKKANSVEFQSACWPGKEDDVNRRLINETAFRKVRVLVARFGKSLGEEELRRMFEECFETCRQGLEAFCLQEERMQHNLRPLEDRDHVRSNAV
jgi:hypothetical protein